MKSNAASIATKLLECMSADNGTRFKPTAAQREELEAAVGDMVGAGVQFNSDEIDLIAAGDQDEAENTFEGTPGYEALNRVLGAIFNGQGSG